MVQNAPLVSQYQDVMWVAGTHAMATTLAGRGEGGVVGDA